MPELCVIIPTYNEKPNLVPLIRRLEAVLAEIDYEVVFVDDDSPDNTSSLARSLAQRLPRVRVIQRVDRKGLSSATVEGMLSTSSPYIAVMDADLQHDESILPRMLETLKRSNLDLVIGTRRASGGSLGPFAAHRVALSALGSRLSRAICRASVSDPMSGYFVLTRTYFQEVVHSLSCVGFKILVDLIASSRRPVRIGEIGYTFRKRLHGESKLDILAGLEYVQLVLDKLTRGRIPASYFVFSMVGGFGLFANLILVYLLLRNFAISFDCAQAAVGLLVIALNFFLNNLLTFRSARLRGVRALQGLVLFYIGCSIGLALNLTAARGFSDYGAPWPVASLIGVATGSMWNYWVTSLFIWQIKRRRSAHLHAVYEQKYALAEVAATASGPNA